MSRYTSVAQSQNKKLIHSSNHNAQSRNVEKTSLHWRGNAELKIINICTGHPDNKILLLQPLSSPWYSTVGKFVFLYSPPANNCCSKIILATLC